MAVAAARTTRPSTSSHSSSPSTWLRSTHAAEHAEELTDEAKHEGTTITAVLQGHVTNSHRCAELAMQVGELRREVKRLTDAIDA